MSLQLKLEGLLESISGRWVGKLLRRAAIRPHKNKYWLTSKDKTDPNFDQRVADICEAYREAITLYKTRGIHCHGTLCLFGNLHVPTGRILAPLIRQSRTEEDYLENIDNVIGLDPQAGYRLISDNLNTHSSESCVRYVAACCGIEEDLGKKGVRGILKSVDSRMAFLSDSSHRIQFLYTPRHCSWLNQIEIWFGTLRSKVTRWMSFASVDELEASIESFIDYFNDVMAKPYNWTYTGKVLSQ